MADDKKKAPIIVRKKKGGHAGAHGGAWKVAYADFVTAMMAFFMVMWLLGSDEEVKASVANYFNNPTSVLRNDMSSKETIPLGDRTGAGDSVLKGAEGDVPEEMVKTPSRPILEGNTSAEDVVEASRLVSSGDKISVEVMKFSIAEKELFEAGSSEKWTKFAPTLLSKIGRLARGQKNSKLFIKGSFGADSGGYEFQVSRTVNVARFLVDHHLIEEDRIVTSVKKHKGEGREPSAATGEDPRIEFVFQ